MRRILLLATLLLAACAHTRTLPPPSAASRAAAAELARAVSVNEFEAGSFGALPYRLLRPRAVEEGKRYPLVVLFHGSGAIGTNNVDQVGPFAKSWATAAMRERHPAFVFIPQTPDRTAVYENSGAATTSNPTEQLREVLRAVDELRRQLPIDPRRIYAAGFSMGGSAVWNAIALRPRLFAAAVAVSSVPNRDALRHLGRTRLLLIHGDADDENPFSADYAAYRAAPRGRVAFWRYRGLGHEFPPPLLTGGDLADWLFAAR